MNGMVAITLVMKDARFVISRHLTDYNTGKLAEPPPVVNWTDNLKSVTGSDEE